MKKRIYLCVILFFTVLTLSSQNWYQGIKMNKSEGFYENDLSTFVVYNGELYAGGLFQSLNGVMCNNIGKYNGSSWSPVGDGVNFRVNSLVVYKGELYAGGTYGVRKWDGSKWSFFGMGNDGQMLIGNDNLSMSVFSMIVYKNELYVGGDTGPVGTLRTDLIKWDGNVWSIVDDKLFAYRKIMSLAVHKDDLYIGGQKGWRDKDEIGYFPIIKWDGTNLSKIEITRPNKGNDYCINKIYKLISFGNELYLGTCGGILKWDGKESISIFQDEVSDMQIFNDELYFCGKWIDLIWKWDGYGISNFTVPIIPNHTHLGIYNNKIFAGQE